MKALLVILTILALGNALIVPVQAQDAAKQDSVKYDPIMAKRADLRIKYTQAQHQPPAVKAVDPKANAGAQSAPRMDRSKLVDFMTLSAKRADLRVRISQVGVKQAYAEWRHIKPDDTANLSSR